MEKIINFNDMAKEFFIDKKYMIKNSTYQLYIYTYQTYLKERIGNINLSEINNRLIQNITNDITFNLNLKKKTIENIITFLKQMVYYGIENNYIDTFILKIKIPPREQFLENNQIETFSNEEIEKIRELCNEEIDVFLHHFENKIRFENGKLTKNNYALAILICSYTGLRIGEVCALKWSDIDLNQNIIVVNKNATRINNYIFKDGVKKLRTEVVITTPKSKCSIRNIPINKKLKEQIIKIKQKLRNVEGEYFLITNCKKCSEPRALRKYYTNILKENDIRYLKFHGLRHTFATQLIEKGIDAKTVSKILGHSNVQITLNKYVHPKLEQMQNAVDIL